MKTFCKYFLSFALGVALSAFTISIFIPGTIQRSRGFWGPGGMQWTQEAFETINSELPLLVDSPYLTFAVVPASSGRSYNVIGFDTRPIAQFRTPNWDVPLAKIDARMDELLDEAQKQSGPGD